MSSDSTQLPQTNLTRAVGRNTIIQFVGKILGTVIGLTTIAVILPYLRPSAFGAYTTAMAYAGFFSVIADLGLYLILIRDLNRPNANAEHVLGNLLALRWVSALAILTTGTIAVIFFQFTITEKISIAIASASFIAVAGTQLLSGLFQSKLAMRYVTTAELTGRAVLLGITWVVVRLDLGLYAIFGAVVLGSVINFSMVWRAAKKFVRIRLQFDRSYWIATLRDTVPIALSIVLNLIYFRADTIILRLFKGAYDVGLYGSAYKILEILNTFPIMFVGLLLPALGAAFAATQPERFRAIFQKGFDLLLMAIVPMLIGGWWLAEPALQFFGGAEYTPAAPALRLLFFAVAALFLGSLSGHTITIINRQRQMVWTYLGVAVLGLTLYLVLIPKYSLYGAAWGTIITESLIALVGYVLITRSMKFMISPRVVPAILLGGVCMWGTIALLAPMQIWVAASIGGFVYVALLILTKTISLKLIRQLLSREGNASAEATPTLVP